jgi:Zn-dependent protease with chaperone function
MLPIPVLGAASIGQTIVTLIAAVVPSIVAWWSDRRLLARGDDPALPELLAHRRRLNLRAISIAFVVLIVLGGTSAAWGIPLMIAMMIVAAYPLRTRLLGETWGFGAYLWNTVASIVGGFGFWIALCFAPMVMRVVVEIVGPDRWWLTAALTVAFIVLLLAWEANYPAIWVRAHAGRPLSIPELTRRFDEIVRKAGTVTPAVYRVGPQGSRFVNAVALPSVKRPSVAIGNALFDLLDGDEITAIFAHEVAHFDHYTPRRVRRTQLINRVLIVVGATLPLLVAFAHLQWVRWISITWPILLLVALGRRAAKSQQHETDSDLRAAALCGDPEALVRGLVKLHAHARIPRRYAVDMERTATHPSLVRRIQAIRAGGAAAVEQLGAATVVRSTREGTWVVLDDTRSYWLDGVPDGTEPALASLREAASSYRAVNYQDLAELRVAVVGDDRLLTARARAGDRWSVPIAPDDVARVQRSLDVVDLKLGRVGPAPTRVAPKFIAVAALTAALLAGQAGVVLAPIFIAMMKPSASALAALGAMSVVRAMLGGIEGSGWIDEELGILGLVAMVAIGAFAIYTAARLAKAGQGKAYLKVTLAVLVAVAVLVGAGVAVQLSRGPLRSLGGVSMVGTFGTVLVGIAAALFMVRARWALLTGFATLAVSIVFLTMSVDLTSVRLRHALTEDTAKATDVASTELNGVASGLHVSPDGSHFVAMWSEMGVRPSPRRRASLATGKIGARPREIPGTEADFVDDARLLVMDLLDSTVVLRLENVDDSVPSWADTLTNVSIEEPRLIVDREKQRWAIVGTEPDSDRTTVFSGKIGEKGSARRAAIPDTLAMFDEPVLFDDGETVIAPSYPSVRRPGAAMPSFSLWMLPFTGFEGPPTVLARVHGDSVTVLATLTGTPRCGASVGGSAMCVAQGMRGASLYVVTSSSATQVARLSTQDLRINAVTRGLRVASMPFDRGVMIVDLATKRLTRVSLPPNRPFAMEVQAGQDWIVTTEYGQNQKSVVRSYRMGKGR